MRSSAATSDRSSYPALEAPCLRPPRAARGPPGGCSRCREARRRSRAVFGSRVRCRNAPAGDARRGPYYRRCAGRPHGRLLAITLLAPTAAAVAIITGAVSWQAAQAPRIESAPPDQPPSAFEQMAIDLHERGVPASGSAALTTASIPEARAWGRRRTGVDVSLPTVRPAEDDGRFDLRGVQAFEYRGARALGVRYSVDGRPVTLTVHTRATCPTARPPGRGRQARPKAAGRAATRCSPWTNSGQSYVLVSDLPADGLPRLLRCHTQTARRAIIEQLAR